VQEGESLFSLAARYYGDKSKFLDIFQANREALKTPDPLMTGTVLVIPGVTEKKDDGMDP
jgi:nucleoid-associated protein YgaU